MGEENIEIVDGGDLEMMAAMKQARETFKYFWRELSWEYRRIMPALSLAAVKVAFTDPNVAPGNPDTEHMWVEDIRCDGRKITGTLVNSPEWLTNVKDGDLVCEPLSAISDWMFVIGTKVYGSFTVNLIRSRLSEQERNEHDLAWGLDFGDPGEVEILFTDPEIDSLDNDEHPASISLGESLQETLQESKDLLYQTDEEGWTMLHRDALAGNATVVKILLEHGADPTLKTPDGDTPYDLAKCFGWKHVLELLPD